MARRERRPAQGRGGDDRLDRAHPVRRDSQLCAAGAGEHGDLSRPRQYRRPDLDRAMDEAAMMRAPRSHRISAWDGQMLHALEWEGEGPALFCLPGLVRTAGDFAVLAAGAGAGRRMVAIDYAGRGGSFRLPSGAALDRYGPEACVRDAMDLAAAL